MINEPSEVYVRFSSKSVKKIQIYVNFPLSQGSNYTEVFVRFL